MIRGLLFDLDGTLVDTLDEITDCLNQSLQSLGLTEHPRERVRAWVGYGSDRLVDRALEPDNCHLHERALEGVRRAFDASGGDASAPYRGIPDLLAKLRRSGLALGVFTNKPHAAARMLVDRFFPATFAFVQGLKEGGPRKPSPLATRNALDHLGLTAAQALLVGDSEVDIEAGRGVGLRVVAVSWGFRSREQLLRERPDWLIDDPGSLVGILAAAEANRAKGRA